MLHTHRNVYIHKPKDVQGCSQQHLTCISQKREIIHTSFNRMDSVTFIRQITMKQTLITHRTWMKLMNVEVLKEIIHTKHYSSDYIKLLRDKTSQCKRQLSPRGEESGEFLGKGMREPSVSL